MAERAAIITGGSSGIGLAIAGVLGEEGYALTLSARRPEKLEDAAQGLRDRGFEVEAVPANMAEEGDIDALIARHRERFGRLDVLVNNAGVGIGGAIADLQTKHLDMQLDVNLRATYIATRECIPDLQAAGREHGKALIVNTASIAAKRGQPALAAYGATKAAIVNFTEALHGTYAGDGIQATALCPAFVATAMTDWVEGVAPEEMIQPSDVAESVRYLLRTTKACFVPEIQFIRADDTL